MPTPRQPLRCDVASRRKRTTQREDLRAFNAAYDSTFCATRPHLEYRPELELAPRARTKGGR